MHILAAKDGYLPYCNLQTEPVPQPCFGSASSSIVCVGETGKCCKDASLWWFIARMSHQSPAKEDAHPVQVCQTESNLLSPKALNPYISPQIPLTSLVKPKYLQKSEPLKRAETPRETSRLLRPCALFRQPQHPGRQRASRPSGGSLHGFAACLIFSPL